MQAQSPWGNEPTQSTTQVVVGGTQPQVLTGQPTNQQVLYVQPPSFKPSPNYRHISYIIIGFGIIFTLVASVLTNLSGVGIFGQLTNSMCCGFLGIACIMDAMYYNDKSAWERQTGDKDSSSILGMITNIILAMISLGMALMFLVTL